MGIGASDEAIIELVHRVHVATAEQVCRRLYSPGSLTYVRDRLARLTRAEYLHRSPMGKASRAGSSPFVYTLDRTGRDHLLRAGGTVDRLRKAQVDVWGYRHLAHALAIADFIVAAELLCLRRQDVRLRRVLTRELAQEPTRVRLATGRTVAVIPDAWLELRRRRSDGAITQHCLALEADRGTEHQPAWREKVGRLAAWVNGPYAQDFGTNVLTIVVTTTDAARLNELAVWTGRELQRLHTEELADRFLFTAVSPAATDATAFFLSPIWSTVTGNGQVPAIRMWQANSQQLARGGTARNRAGGR